MQSYLTPDELSALQTSGLHKNAPFTVQGKVFNMQQLPFCKYFRHQGSDYTYNPVTDELIRSDVLKWVEKRRKVQDREKKAQMVENQGRLF